MSSYNGEGSEDMPLLSATVVSSQSQPSTVAATARRSTSHPHRPSLERLDAVFGGTVESSAGLASNLMEAGAALPRKQSQGDGVAGTTISSSGHARMPSPSRIQQQLQSHPLLQPIQQQNATTTKRVAKPSRPRKAISEFRKKTRHFPPKGWQGRVGVHVQVDEINVEQLCLLIKSKMPDWDVIDYYDAMRIWQTEPPYIGHEKWSEWPVSEDEDAEGGGAGGGVGSIDFEAARPEVYLFSFGAAVFWNFPSDEFEAKWLKEQIFTPFPDAYGTEHTTEETDAAKDEMAFIYGQQFSLKRDVASLETRETGERLAVSFALAKSSLLTVYEERVQKTIDRNSHIPEEMVKNGRLHMTRQDISREVGRMLLVKHGINLDSVRRSFDS